MLSFTPEEFENLLVLAAEWAAGQEAYILKEGTPLSAAELELARKVGVGQPERIRLLAVKEIPLPSQPALAAAAEATGLISAYTIGMSFRYGIFVRDDMGPNQRLLAHELVHTLQYERLGSIQAFLRKYLLECLIVGYPEAAMEQEAVQKAEEIVPVP
jgi:hypothetical protein